MRQICNVAFAAQVQWLDEKEYKQFLRELDADPAAGPVSHGTGDLMAMMRGGRA